MIFTRKQTNTSQITYENPSLTNGLSAVAFTVLSATKRDMRVLIADDDGMFTSIIEAGLPKKFEVSITHDGNDVVTSFIDGHRLGTPFNVILLDLNLPHLDGHRILERIRKHEQSHLLGKDRVFIAITSGSSDTNDIHKAIQMGCDHYFIKPVNPDDVTAKILAIKPQKIKISNTSPKRVPTGSF